MRATLAANPGMGREALAKACNTSIRRVRRLRGMVEPEVAKADEKPVTSGTCTLNDLRRRFDVPQKIRTGIKQHLRGDIFIDDHQFREMCGVPIARWRRIADSAEFMENRMKIDGTLHWARPESISAAKSIMGIS
jgi:hypothetical protein